MKKIALAIIFLLIGMISLGQDVYKFKANKLRSIVKDKFGDFNAISEWVDISAIVVFDATNSSLRFIGAEKEDKYDVLKWIDTWTDDTNDKILKYSCLDAKGLKCNFRVMANSSTSPSTFTLYLDYSDVSFEYKVARD
jgi:hypothetical protein